VLGRYSYWNTYLKKLFKSRSRDEMIVDIDRNIQIYNIENIELQCSSVEHFNVELYRTVVEVYFFIKNEIRNTK